MPDLDDRLGRENDESGQADNGCFRPSPESTGEKLPLLEKDTSPLSYVDIIMESLVPSMPTQLKDGDKVRLSKLSASGDVVLTKDKAAPNSADKSGKVVGKVDSSYDETDRRNDEKRQVIRGSGAAAEQAVTKISDIASKIAQLLQDHVLPTLDINESDSNAASPKQGAVREQSANRGCADSGRTADSPAAAERFWGDRPQTLRGGAADADTPASRSGVRKPLD
jgi:hypothetical protein